MARQCVPKDGSCTSDPEVCVDDGREENDSLEAASAKPPLELVATVSGLKTCPSDVDWYRLVIDADSEVTVAIAGTSASDLDLVLTDNRGRTVDRALTNSSNETLTHCLPPGTYYAQVRTYGPQQPNTYSLTTSGANVVCPDQGEEDDTTAQSRAVTLFGLPWLEIARRITANDDDYHKVYLTAGDTLEVRLDFVHSAGDLDIHLLTASGIDLTPCIEEDPLIPGTCKTEWGQGTSSPEILTYPITTTGYYHVVVHGWDGDANRYAVCITADGGC